MTNKSNCIICGKELSKSKYKLCKSCSFKNQFVQKIRTHHGKNNPNWKGGEVPHCIDCDKKIKNYYAKRCKSCARIEQYKNPKNHPQYLDGKSKEPYTLEFNEQLKESIRKRDNYECQNCNITEEEHLIVIGMNLPVHHIDYDKNNCKENNLITLCVSCNVRANYNRNYWQDFYKNKVRVYDK